MASIIKEVLFNDGEGLDYNDLNNVQRFSRAYLNDLVVGPAAKTAAMHTAPVNTGVLYSRGANARPLPGLAGGLTVQNDTGLVAQIVDVTGADGVAPKFLWHQLTLRELTFTLAAADATNPRWDIICFKIDEVTGDTETRDFKDATTGVLSSTTPNKRRNTRLQTQVVTGTPSATPAEPAVPAGYVRWCRVMVPATFPGPFVETTHFADHRVPLGWEAAVVPGNRGFLSNVAGVGGLGGVLELASASGFASYTAIAPSSDPSRRLMGVSFFAGGTPNQGLISIGGYNFVTAASAGVSVDATASLAPTGAKAVKFLDLSSTPVWLGGYSVCAENSAVKILFDFSQLDNTGLSTYGYLIFHIAGGW